MEKGKREIEVGGRPAREHSRCGAGLRRQSLVGLFSREAHFAKCNKTVAEPENSRRRSCGWWQRASVRKVLLRR